MAKKQKESQAWEGIDFPDFKSESSNPDRPYFGYHYVYSIHVTPEFLVVHQKITDDKPPMKVPRLLLPPEGKSLTLKKRQYIRWSNQKLNWAMLEEIVLMASSEDGHTQELAESWLDSDDTENIFGDASPAELQAQV